MILYNTLHYHRIHRDIQLNELKALIKYFAMEADFMKQQFIKSRFTHVSVFRYHDNMQISWKFWENSQILVAVFKAPV